jgi:guanylate kinase
MKLLVIIGPSGSGKSRAMRELQRRGLIAVTPSWTTRPQRADESRETVEHRFVDDGEFDRLEGEGFFLEVISLFGYRYGLPPVEQPSAGVIPTIMMRAPRLNLVDKHYPDHIVYQIEAPFEDARARVLAAGQIPEDDIRLSGWGEERALGEQLADRVIRFSGSVSDLIKDLQRALIEDFPS